MSKETDNRSLAALAGSEIGPEASFADEQVVEYLRQHPDFFADRAELLQIMTPPVRWSGDTVVDMQRYMVESLRGEIAGLRDCANEVIETSRANLAIQSRTHAAVLALVAVPDLDHLIRAVCDDLPILLDVDVAMLSLEPAPALELMIGGIGRLQSGDVERFVGAGLVRSAALARIRCGEEAPVGLLAFGSRRDAAFHPGQGTELLRFLAKVVEVCLVRMLPTPA